MELMVDGRDAPALGEGEWWAHELEGCEVLDGEQLLGTVSRLIELPSCEALEVRRDGGGEPVLVPMVKDAVRRVDAAERRIEVNLDFLGARRRARASEPGPARGRRERTAIVNIDVFTLFPEWFEWFTSQRHVATCSRRVELRVREPPRSHAAERRPGRRHAVRRRRGNGAARGCARQRAARPLRRRPRGAARAAPGDRAGAGRTAARRGARGRAGRRARADAAVRPLRGL